MRGGSYVPGLSALAYENSYIEGLVTIQQIKEKEKEKEEKKDGLALNDDHEYRLERGEDGCVYWRRGIPRPGRVPSLLDLIHGYSYTIQEPKPPLRPPGSREEDRVFRWRWRYPQPGYFPGLFALIPAYPYINPRGNTILHIDSLTYSLIDTSIIGKGSPFVEVFSVRVIDREDSSDLYGTIDVHDGCGTRYIYERQRSNSCDALLGDLYGTDEEEVVDNSEPIGQFGTLSLTGPHCCCINFISYFALDVTLEDKFGSPFPNAMSRHLLCNYFGFQNYDKRLKDVFGGDSGSVEVYYTVFRDAVQAKVDVEVLRKVVGGEELYGRIVARYSDYDYSTDEQKQYYQTVLFDKPASNSAKLEPCKIVPLTRHLVVVPTTSALVIEANLWYRRKTVTVPVIEANLWDCDTEIANGRTIFSPQTWGTSVNYIKGNFSGLRVVVSWLADFDDL